MRPLLHDRVEALRTQRAALGRTRARRIVVRRDGVRCEVLDERGDGHWLALGDLEGRVFLVNPDGGAIALGHPLGASGARLATTAVNRLHATCGRYALCTMCIGVGQGIAVILEKV